MNTTFITVEETNKIASIALNRPDKHNAMHAPMIAELSAALTYLNKNDSRVLIIYGKGQNFCAGGDIANMQAMANCSKQKNDDDAQQLADLLQQLYHFSKPTILLAHGKTLGGGLGLMCAADIALATNTAEFSFPEVKMGLIPSIISPYVLAAIGQRQAQYYFLTGEKYTALKALQMGLIHEMTDEENLMPAGFSLAKKIMQNGPQALQAAKKLIACSAMQPINADLAQKTAKGLADLRITPEAQEGLKAFLEKRKPQWVE